MTTPGTGGLPPRRPDQMRTYAPPTQAPGAAAGTVRARIIEVIGGPNSGVFGYSGAPGLGNLIFSLVGNTTADPFLNPVKPNGLAFYNGPQVLFLGLSPSIPDENVLTMATGEPFEGQPFQVDAAGVGSGGTAFIAAGMVGPATNTAGATDFAEVSLNSAQENGGSFASGQLLYIAAGGGATVTAFWNNAGFTIPAGTINGIAPGAGTLTGAVTAGAPPSGAGGASASTLGGAALSYFDALETDFNDNAAALNDVVNLLLGWGV